jgi:hypothetical protein
MRAAPPVQATSRVGGGWWLAQRVLVAVVAANLVHWLAGWLDAPALAAPIAAGLAAALAWVWASTRRLPQAWHLHWDGAHWSLGSPSRAGAAGEASGSALPMIDLGTWMLVRFDPSEAGGDRTSRPQWLVFSGARDPAAWRALRVALYAGAPGRGAAAGVVDSAA